MRKYLAAERFSVDGIVHTTEGVVGMQGTPIILAVNSAGVVKDAFVGKLDTGRENEVLSILQRGKV